MNRRRFTEAAAVENAYCIQEAGDDDGRFAPGSISLLADRYGGFGVGRCGGSARCGLRDRVQIKGVGRNPLYAAAPRATPDELHSTGSMTLAEAAREAIWSGIIGSVFPHGAVPALAIVLTGTRVSSNFAGGDRRQGRRALLLREPTVRPAHLMRNLLFETPYNPSHRVREDVLRTRQALSILLSGEPLYPGEKTHADGRPLRGSLNTRLVSVARRLAEQAASGFARRIFHGALNCSNVALDGRLLDFGTTTTTTGHHRLASFPLGLDAWTQRMALLRTAKHLRLHVAKYLGATTEEALICEEEIAAEFEAASSARVDSELIRLTGLPDDAISEVPLHYRKHLAQVCRSVITRGATGAFVWRGDDDASMEGIEPLQAFGRFSLNSILANAPRYVAKSSWEDFRRGYLDDERLCHDFVRAYDNVISHVLNRTGARGAAPALERIVQDASRLNGDLTFLVREQLDAALESFEEDPCGLESFIDATVRRAVPQFVADGTPANIGSVRVVA